VVLDDSTIMKQTLTVETDYLETLFCSVVSVSVLHDMHVLVDYSLACIEPIWFLAIVCLFQCLYVYVEVALYTPC